MHIGLFSSIASANKIRYHNLMSLESPIRQAQGKLKVALVHDELIRRGGAELVLEELVRIFPKADIYTLYAGNVPKMTVDGKTYNITTSSLQKILNSQPEEGL